MPKSLQSFIGLILLLFTVGSVSCQALLTAPGAAG